MNKSFAGATRNQHRSSSEDEGGGCSVGKRKRSPTRWKKHIKQQKFVIHPSNLRATLSELSVARKSATTIPLDDGKSETEIRASLVEKLPQLMGESFKFLTKGKHGNHLCPCSSACIDPAHARAPVAQWNGKNIKMMARGHKVVYIHLQNFAESSLLESARIPAERPATITKIGGQNSAYNELQTGSTETMMFPTDTFQRSEEKRLEQQKGGNIPINCSVVVSENGIQSDTTPDGSSSHLAGRSVRGKLLPTLATKRELSQEEIISLVDVISLQDNNHKLSANHEEEKRQEEVEDEDEDEGEDECEWEEEDDEEEEQEQEKSETQSGDENFAESLLEECTRIPTETSAMNQTRIGQDSAYDTLHTGSTTTIFAAVNAAHRSEIMPLLSTTGPMETVRIQERMRTTLSVTIGEIAPTEGSVEGGYTFLITLDTALVSHGDGLQVLFGAIPAESVRLTGDRDLVKGKVPRSPTTGVVQVQLLNSFGETISNMVPFEYNEQKDKYNEERRRKRRNYLDGELTSSEDCLEMMSLVFEKMRDMELNSKGGTRCNGNARKTALCHLRMIVETAAKINAMEFFTIIFSTSVGRNVFKSFKNEELLLEELARENGHEELAMFLEQRHLMYCEDESDSDDEVDWESLAKAVRKFQRQNDESAASSDCNDYNGDVEDCVSLLSENDRIMETFSEEPFEKEETNYLGNCQEVPQTIILEESISLSKSSLPDLAGSFFGRDVECEEIIGNLTSNQFRLGVIYGVPGIGKTSVAVDVGHKLRSKGWTVNYHNCSNHEASSEISTLLTNLYRAPISANHLKKDNGNETLTVNGSHLTLLIIDQVENLLGADESAIVSEALQTFVDAVLEVNSVKLLLVSRERINLSNDIPFLLKLGPLSNAASVQLMESVFKNTSQHDLGVIAEGCRRNPLALMIVRALINNGMTRTDIISEMSSPEHFWKKLLHSFEKCHVLSEAETKGVQKDSLKLSLSSLMEPKSTVQMQMFLESWIEKRNYLGEDEVGCCEESPDPRYCSCRLCMSSGGNKSLKLTLRSSVSLADLTQDNDEEKFQHSKYGGQFPATKDGNMYFVPQKASNQLKLTLKVASVVKKQLKNQSVGCLGVLVSILKFLRSLSLERRFFYDMKATPKKGKESTPKACVIEPLISSHSCGTVVEQHLSTTPASDGVPSAVKEKENRVGNTVMENVSTVPVSSHDNIDDEITAAPPLLAESPSRKKKKTKLPTQPWRCSRVVLFASAALSVIAATTILLWFTLALGKGSENNVNQKVNSGRVPAVTVTTINFNSSGITNGTSSKVICKSEKISNCSRSCPEDHFEVLNLANKENDCWPCPTCHPGAGLSVPCGSIIEKGTVIECRPCETGITFSSSFRDSCQNCSQCQPNETVVRPCRPLADTVCAGCGSNQSTWIDSKRELYGCFDCPICSSGFEPSHLCGSTVPHGSMITCIPCKEGETFSALTDREQCKRCSSCPPGQRIVVRCTKYFDTVCERKCGGDQVTLFKGYQKPTKVECIDCLICPAGMEPSVACGAVVKNDVALRCVPCIPGLTYSDFRSKHGCKTCTTCPPGKLVVSQCSIHRDTVCSTKCATSQISISIESTVTCVDCIECSVGMEPAIPCGSLVHAWPRQQCTPCKTNTFSDTYGTGRCKPCHSCHSGTTVKRCTRISDSLCRICKDQKYFDPKILSCYPCSRCCNDGKDSYPRECAHLKSTRCEARMCLPNSRAPPVPSISSIPHLATSTIKVPESTRFILISAVVCLVLVVAGIIFGWLRTSGRKSPIDLPRSLRRSCVEAGEITLEKLDARHMELFEWMCSKLDNGRWGFRRDFERLASKYTLITPEQCEILRNEQASGRSPSRLLMSFLQVSYPDLPLSHFVHTLKAIGRLDIVQKLIPLI